MNEIDTAANMIAQSKKLVVFTGAGLSTESGISDFRSPGGVWSRFDPREYTFQKFMSSEESREKYWAFSTSSWGEMAKAKPNAGHKAIAELESIRKLDCIITQNIDGLHQRSGIPDEKVIELHGTARWVSCLDCGQRYPREQIQDRIKEGIKVPRCDKCGGIMKPATISFGQAMPERETHEAESRAYTCDLFLVAGSSLVVYPAAQMPLIAKDNAAGLIIINLTPTPQDSYADIVIHDQIGPALSQIIDRAKAQLS